MSPAAPTYPGLLHQRLGRVLVVDTYAAVRVMVAELLTYVGYTVTCTASAEDALIELAAAPQGFDLLITALDLTPGMWGDALVSHARVWAPTLRAIIMLGPLDEVSGRAQLDPLAVARLPKPFTPADLRITVRRAFTQPEALGPVYVGAQQ